VERNPLALPLHLRVLGFLELSLGDAQAAEKQLSRAVEVSEASGILEPGVLRIHADATEALIAIGELERAAALLGRLEKRGRAVGLAWSCATAHRCRGLLHAAQGELDDALAALDAALAEHERLPMPLERARTLLVKGQIERRAKQRRRARESLGQALASFEQLGAPLWAAKTRAELRRIGPRPSGSDELTPTEQQVGELAAAGLTNRKIASALFVSPKTVEANLARIYRKLGIHSRAELGARMAERARAGTEAM
jgi:DNA-binding NarL/FixJ family response regulator